jgi:hypothetical protein
MVKYVKLINVNSYLLHCIRRFGGFMTSFSIVFMIPLEQVAQHFSPEWPCEAEENWIWSRQSIHFSRSGQ